MSVDDIERHFPALRRGENYAVRSDPDFNYNCLAFVFGDVQNWWEPLGEYGFYWPPGFPGDTGVETVSSILRLHGFVVEVEPSQRPVAESIAIYAKGDEWTHLAKFAGGTWVSKIGADHDISHTSLDQLEGDLYGTVVKVLSRTK